MLYAEYYSKCQLDGGRTHASIPAAVHTVVVTHPSAVADQKVDQQLQSLVAGERVRIRLGSVENLQYSVSGRSIHFGLAALDEQSTDRKLLE